MKRALLLVSIIFIIQSTIFTQEVKTIVQEAFIQETIQEESYPLPGSHLLRERKQYIQKYLESHPEARRLVKTRSIAWNFNNGDTYTWWATNLDTNDDYEVPSTCHAVGTNCYIFVEDVAWNSNRVDQTAVDAIVDAFDNTTPNFPAKGIYDVDIETFGDAPDVDSDPRIIILILDILDGYDGSGGYTAGYINPENAYPDGDPIIGGRHSNFAEIFYMDCNPANLLTENGRQVVLHVTAHEFQHMIHWHHDYGDMTFVDEGLSEIASYICGYSITNNGLYTQNTNRNLLAWDHDDTFPDYSRAAFWTLYIYEQYPIGILKDFVNNHHSAWYDIESTLSNYTPVRDFFTFFEDWLIANYVNGNSNDSKYTYQYSPLSKPEPVATYIGNPNGAGASILVPFGAEYIKFSGGSDLEITFTGDNGIKIYALKIGSLEVEEVNRNELYSPDEFGSTFTEITFLVYNQIQSNKNYSYVATGTAIAGTMEIAYEDGEPEGLLQFTPGDSSAVFFSGIAGARLDSIKVAFRRSGIIQMDISTLDGQTFFRGANLYGPAQINSPGETASVPYPVPYDNWVTVGLSSENIDASNDFVVSFLIGSDPLSPGIMVSSEPDDGVRHSRTYVKSDDTWYPYGVSGSPGNIWNYLIRAYVSIGGATIAIDQTGIVTIPDAFSLEQNYPNPFNPSTTFRFSTPKDGLIKFTVHDLLGRVVYSENRNLFAGNYSFTWEGNNMLNQQVVSDVYFLRMEAEGYSQTRKMLLLR